MALKIEELIHLKFVMERAWLIKDCGITRNQLKGLWEQFLKMYIADKYKVVFYSDDGVVVDPKLLIE